MILISSNNTLCLYDIIIIAAVAAADGGVVNWIINRSRDLLVRRRLL
jgi:hypothetical protein